MKEESLLTEHDSMLIIQQMINTAKKEQKDDGRGWRLWGWLLLLASLTTIANLHFRWFESFFFWNLFGVAALILMLASIFKKRFFKGPEKVKTYTSDLFSKLNAGFFISLMFIIISLNVSSRAIYLQNNNVDVVPIINVGFALLINLYAFWMLIYGSALNFRPSIFGAYISWALGIAAMFMEKFEYVMWLHALAVVAGYIIPGHIAHKEFNKVQRGEKE